MKIILLDFLAQAEDIQPIFSAQDWPILFKLLQGKSHMLPIAPLWQMIEPESVANWPGAAPITLAYDMPEAQAGFWLRADPVLLQPSIDNLILLPANHLAITQAESDALIQSLNHHFVEDGMTFYAPTPDRWYVHCTVSPQIDFTALEEVVGRQIDVFLPAGEEALLWHRYLNEIQMLFYTHPVNEARALARQPLISSVWFWGGGQYPVPLQGAKRDIIYTDKENIVQQAKVLGYQAALLKDKKDKCQDEEVWILTDLKGSLAKGGIAAWRNALTMMELQYLQTAYRALQSKHISKIELIVANDNLAYQIVNYRADKWRFWQKISTDLLKLTPFRRK